MARRSKEWSARPSRFKASRVRAHLKKFHPNCPEEHKCAIVLRVVNRVWFDVSLGKAVGITINCYVRHEMTEYDALLEYCVERIDARASIKINVDGIISGWGPTCAYRGDPGV
jgi:hypothetical protein